MPPHGIFLSSPKPSSLGTSLKLVSWKNSGDDKSPEVLVMELSSLKMNPKEKVKDFNQIFLR
jgi:hypothetical protein